MNYSIGKIIRKIRKEKKLTQEELAEQLCVTSRAVSKWENETGLPDITQIVPLCRVLEISADEFFGVLGTNADEEVEKFMKERELFAYCYSGAKSHKVVVALEQMGYIKVNNIGGILSYRGKVER